MEKLIEQYAQKTGAKGISFVADTDRYGDVWELRYGGIGSDGLIEPTGLPVLVYIKDGEVRMVPGEDALELLSFGED